MGGGTNRFSSLGSSRPHHLRDRLVEHPGAEPANRRMRGTRHTASRPCERSSSSRTASPSTLPAGSAAGGPLCPRLQPAPWAEVSRLLSLPGALSQVRAPASIWCLPTLPTRKALAYSDPLPPGQVIVAAHLSLSW